MPTQLKIVAENGYVQSAPFTVNFAAPVIIQPGQKIALDKFTALVEGITTNFILPATQFDLYISVNSPNLQMVTINVPTKYYNNASQLLADLTTYCNNAITGYLPDALPATGLSHYYRDIGVKVECISFQNKFQINYVTCPEIELPVAAVNMSSNPAEYYFPTAVGAFSVNQVSTTQYLCQGGGALVEWQFVMPTVAQAVLNDCTWQCGLADDDGVLHGLTQDEDGSLWLVNGIKTVQLDTQLFADLNGLTTFYQLFQAGGNFVFRLLTRDDVGGEIEETTHYLSSTLSPTALGSQNYTQQYLFQFDGVLGVLNALAPVPQMTMYPTMTVDVAYGPATAAPDVFSRTMAIDMTDAGTLQSGLDVPPGVILLTPPSSYYGTYTAETRINLSILKSSFDLAIEILDIPLQTYAASSNGRSGQRNNVVAYFHPELSAVGTSVYVYNSASYQWLDIDISYPLNLSSMSFRVYNPDTNIDLNAHSMSFNLLIGDKAY
tara:strand:- start:1553 stop:3028 length:1476 start_codon:yes stop_codon:yes gene_type:complete